MLTATSSATGSFTFELDMVHSHAPRFVDVEAPTLEQALRRLNRSVEYGPSRAQITRVFIPMGPADKFGIRPTLEFTIQTLEASYE